MLKREKCVFRAMEILTFYFFVLMHCFIVECLQCPNHCYCYMWRNMIRTDCANKNLYNTFLGFFHETEVLDLSYNVISILHGNEFQDANLRQLKDLRLSNNRLHVIDKLSFNGLQLLENIDLSYNHIEYFSPVTFKYNPNLKVLNISNNPLRFKRNEAFLSTAPSLKVLNMAHCNLQFVSAHLFLNLERLQVLNISHNYFREIHPEALQMMKDLKFLDISKNVLTCNEKSKTLFRWLTDSKIIFHPFCQIKNQNLMSSLVELQDANYLEELYRMNLSHESNTTETVSREEKNIFVSALQFLHSIPPYYAVLCGIQVGILIGVLSTYFCMRKVAQMSSAPLRNVNRNDERSNFVERPSRVITNDSDMTFSLIPLNTPPGTPPSPYHSRLTFPSTFSLPT